MRPSIVTFPIVALVLGAAACTTATTGGGGPGADGGTAGNNDGGAVLADGATVPSGGGAALPTGTFLFTRRVAPDTDHLVARDLATGNERVVTDLRGDGSEGWTIDGFALSPDRTRIVIASLYGPTAADNATGLATQRIWTFDTAGKSFVRLTPVFKNPRPGVSGFRIDVRDPVFSADGKTVYYTYGEGTFSQAGTRTWGVSTEGGGVPALLDTPASCTIASVPSVNPVTGKVLIIQDICREKVDESFVYFAGNGRAAETVLTHGAASPTYRTPGWAVDGSLFVYGAGPAGSASLYAFTTDEKQVVPLVVGGPNKNVRTGAVAPDGSAIVYCVGNGTANDLHALDLTADPIVDRAITTDGASCNPVF